MALKVQLFGGLRVWRDGETEPIRWPEWRTRKCMQLLAILISERGRAISQSELIDRLWPDSEPLRGSLSLRDAVSHVRRVLEPTLKRGWDSKYIETVLGGYRFSSQADCEIDSERFKQAYRQGQTLQWTGQCRRAVDYYERAFGLYQGDYLAEERYESWALAYQECWKRIHLELLTRLSECYAHLGQYQRAIERAEQAIEMQPLCNEMIYRHVMVCYARLGDQVGMMRTFERLKGTLAQSFEAEPSAETRALYEAIRQGKVEFRVS